MVFILFLYLFITFFNLHYFNNYGFSIHNLFPKVKGAISPPYNRSVLISEPSPLVNRVRRRRNSVKGKVDFLMPFFTPLGQFSLFLWATTSPK